MTRSKVSGLRNSLFATKTSLIRRDTRKAFRKLAIETLEHRRVLAAAPLTGAVYTQNFDSLISSGSVQIIGGLFPDGANGLQGWAFSESGTNNNESYAANSGTSNAGETYSLGVAGTNAVTDRAFGTLQSSNLVATIGASFQNVTAASFDSIRVSYTGEQWRLGATGRNDRLDFQYSTNATSLTTGTWTDVNELDFIAPVSTGTVGAMDGNAPGNQVAFSNIVLPSVTLSPGSTFWIRWLDANASGADDSLAIDDFSISTSSTSNAGVTITEFGGDTAVTEGGTTDTYTIALQTAPSSNVTISINAGSQLSVSPSTLIFTPTNWATPQFVTVTAVNDSAVEGTHVGTLIHAATSNDATYNAIPISSVTATITDNDGTPTATNLRIVNYNVASSNGSVRTGLDTILQGIGSEIVAGFARQIDLIAFQEVDVVQTVTSTVADLLNNIYGAGIYVSGTLAGLTTGAGTPGIVYNSQTLQLLGEAAVGTVSGSGQTRQTLRHHFQPIGGGINTDFYVYNSHWKGENDSESEGRRLIEAQAIRNNADALGNGKNILYVGDFNVYRSSDDGFQELLSSGNGQAFDPINRLGNWSNNSSFRDVHTQAPLVNAPSGLVGGGLDDRFDFQLISGELNDGVGLEYRAGSYHTFGNNGSVSLNGNINASSNTALPGMANRTTLLNRLSTVSDHLPVVADYTFTTFTDTTPPTVVIDDNDADNSVFVGTPVIYTLTFSEDILAGTVTAADFNNAGTASISIGTVTETAAETFSVTVTPSSAGTIILRIPTGSVISDLGGNNLVVPVQDADTITVVALANPTITISSGNRVYNNAVYTATASISGSNSPQPSLSFVYYSNAAATNVISAPTNVGTYYVRAFSAANVGNNAAQSAVTQFQITPFALTGNITAANKIFDGTTNATILTRSLVGVFSGDMVSYVGGVANFASTSVGTNKLVTATGLSLTGADAGNYTVNTTATTTANIAQPVATIANRRVFYNGATGANLSSLGAAENAIASDKTALLPGGTSSFANYTNYSRGLNGVIVDINNLPATTTPSQMLASLQFAQWNGIDLAEFTGLPSAAIPAVTILPGSGVGGSTRVKIVFPDNTLQNTWLRVSVVASSQTALAANDVFYFGNVIGEVNTGNTSGRLRVNATDTGSVRSNQSTASNSVGVSNIYDVNRDGRVNANDTGIVRSNQQTAGIVAPLSVPLNTLSASTVSRSTIGENSEKVQATPLIPASKWTAAPVLVGSNVPATLRESAKENTVESETMPPVTLASSQSQPAVIMTIELKRKTQLSDELSLQLKDDIFASFNEEDWSESLR